MDSYEINNPKFFLSNNYIYDQTLAIKYTFPRTIKIVEIIFSKNTIDLRLKENIAIKSSPDELLFVISTLSSDGLN